MGKNEQHKARQRSKGSQNEGADEDLGYGDGVDASFHTAEWHAARLEALNVERPSWEDWKKKKNLEAIR